MDKKEKVRVAFVEQESGMGGVEVSTLDLARMLKGSRYQPIVLLPTEGALAEACRRWEIKIVFYKRPQFRSASVRWRGHTVADPLAMVSNPLRLWQSGQSIAHLLKEEQVDLVITKGLLSHYYGGYAARRLDLPCIWHVQDEIPTKRAGGLYLKSLQMASRRWAKAVVGDADTITAQFPSHPYAQTIYNGVDVDAYAPTTTTGTLRRDLGIPDTGILIGNLARLTDWKGQHLLIEAFNQIAPIYPHTHLVLIGSPLFDNDQYEKRLQQLAQNSPMKKRIHFAGYRTDANACLAALDCYVHCSIRKDTAPLALISALATGLPIIISDVAGMVEIVEPEQTALIVPAGSVNELAHALKRLLDAPSLRNRLGREARNSAVSHFSLQSHMEAMHEIFDTILQDQSPRIKSSPRVLSSI